MRDLLDPRKTPKVPKEVRRRAYDVLRHYPADFDINYAADGAPSSFGHLEEDANRYLECFKEAVRALPKTKKKKKKND